MIADAAGWRVASAVLAVATLPLIPLVARYAAPRTTGERLESLRLRAAFGLVRRNRAIAGAALVSALLGVVGGVSGLLLPLALAGNGLSAGGIGLAFGLSAGVWIAAATVVGRLRASAVHLRGVGIVVAVLAGAWLLPAFRLSTLALVAFLARLDRVPLDDQRAQLRRRRARERGHLGADGDRRDEPRVGRDGARHPAARGPRGGELRGEARVRRDRGRRRGRRGRAARARARAAGSPRPS